MDASDSAISNEGFKYFSECRRINKLKLNFCDYFTDDAIRELATGRPADTVTDIVSIFIFFFNFYFQFFRKLF